MKSDPEACFEKGTTINQELPDLSIKGVKAVLLRPSRPT